MCCVFLPITAFAEDESAPTSDDLLIMPISESLACGNNHGLTIKTVSEAAIYSIGCDGLKHLFPNQIIFKSWWQNFEDVSFVEKNTLDSDNLSDRVTIRPGTYLVKSSSDPKVYAVEPGAVLRWIPNEATAELLYGKNWNKIIIDIPGELLPDYVMGQPLTGSAYPNGVVGFLSTGRVVYLSGLVYYNLPGEIFDSLRFQNEFFIPLASEVMTNYIDGGDLIYDTTIAFPY